MAPLHATAIAQWAGGTWRGALLRGSSGTGKSGLALRMGLEGWRLVADDRVIVFASAGRLFGRAPAILSGLVEARGLGVLPFPTLDLVEIALVVDLAETVERMPEPRSETLAGVVLPLISLRAGEPEAPAKLALAMACARRSLGAGR